MKTRFRKWIKKKFNLYDISDLQIGAHCGTCGTWLSKEIVEKEWAVSLCPDCLKK